MVCIMNRKKECTACGKCGYDIAPCRNCGEPCRGDFCRQCENDMLGDLYRFRQDFSLSYGMGGLAFIETFIAENGLKVM